MSAWKIWALVLAFAVWSGGIWKVQEWRHTAAMQATLAGHEKLRADQSEKLAAAVEKARKAENQLASENEARSRDTQEKIDAVIASERSAYDGRVRDVAAAYAARYRADSAATAATIDSKAAEAALRMLADMLGQLESMATVYAAQADERRIRGLECEADYDAARDKLAQH